MHGILVLAALAAASDQTARPPQRLDLANSTATTSHAADMDAGLAAVAWVDSSLGADAVWVSVSSDVAWTWLAPVRVDLDASGAAKTLLASSVNVVAGEVRVSWLDRRNASRDNLYFCASRDGGATWGPETRVDDGHASGSAQIARFAARADGAGATIAVALLLQGLPGGDEVRVTRSTDAGLTFAASSALHAGGSARALDLEMDGAALHLAWTDDTLTSGLQTARYLRSLDGGATWPGAAVAVSGTVNVLDGVLDLAAAGARVSAVFQDLFAIHAVGSNHSTDGGLTWLAVPLRVAGSRSPTVTPARPRLFFTPSEVLVAWSDDRATPGLLTPWLAGTSDSGAHWFETPLTVSLGEAPEIGAIPPTEPSPRYGAPAIGCRPPARAPCSLTRCRPSMLRRVSRRSSRPRTTTTRSTRITSRAGALRMRRACRTCGRAVSACRASKSKARAQPVRRSPSARSVSALRTRAANSARCCPTRRVSRRCPSATGASAVSRPAPSCPRARRAPRCAARWQPTAPV